MYVFGPSLRHCAFRTFESGAPGGTFIASSYFEPASAAFPSSNERPSYLTELYSVELALLPEPAPEQSNKNIATVNYVYATDTATTPGLTL